MRTSTWWRVRVHTTEEEQIFDSKSAAMAWIEKVISTFGESLDFDLIKVTENTTIIQAKY